MAATSHEQLVFSVQLSLRQAPPSHTSPERQSAFTVQPLLQLDKGIGVGVDVEVCEVIAVGVGVFVGVEVGVPVGVEVGVGDGLPVNVGVGLPVVARTMVNVHAATAALGFS